MRNIVSIAAAGAVALALGACGETELQKAKETSAAPTASPFTQSLNKYYLDAAQSQWAGHSDFAASEHFAQKAQAAAAGQVVAPDTIQEQGRAVKKNGELTEAREHLMAAMDRQAATKIPDEAARAQVAYDCWLSEARDPSQAVESKWLEKKVRNCRTDFYSAMASVDAATKLAGQYVAHDKYVVYFDSDSANISDEGMKTLLEAADIAREDHVVHINITANADRTGTAQHNQMLSERRAEAVRRILVENGVARNLIIAEGRGENDPQVATADGIAEQENRSAIITLERQ